MNAIEGHARIPPPGWEDIRAEAAIAGITPEAATDKLLRMRAKTLELEAMDPLRNGYEPQIWHVCDALLGFPYCYDRSFLKQCRARLPECQTKKTDKEVWDTFCELMRKFLGFARAVKALLIMGGNRAAKSEYAAKRSMMIAAEKENANIYAMHMSEPRSKRDQQPLFWKYMPQEWQVQMAGLVAYIKYKKKTGFAENSFITPIGSQGAFLNYMQNKDTALQGMEADVVVPDELIPADWIDDIMLRLATRAGIMIPTFTPINGYTPTVKIFCDSAKVVKTIPAYLCPRDGGDPDEAKALHLTAEQYAELWKAVDGHRAAMVPQSQPEDVIAWLEPGAGEAATPGRLFDEVPRVLKCVDPRKAVVFFNPSDNPYGNPKEVMADLRKKSKAYVRERFYGQAEKTISVLIPKFSRKIHVIPANRIPAGGTNYFFYDPASDRNSFMSWFRRKGRDVYLYREWPGRYHVPGVGIPGPWAIPSGRKDGLNDGDPGEGQKPSFGFGNARYKFEMARLERWTDWKKWMEEVCVGPIYQPGKVRVEYPNEEDLAEWDTRDEEGNPTRAEEIIISRFIDSRAASSPRIENDRPVTLQTLFDEINVFFFLTPGADIADGVSKINSELDYELDETGRIFINPAHFFVSEECENSIYAFENWMNADGQNGACKDPIDLPRYFFTAECEDIGPSDYQPRGGVSYGRKNPSDRGANRIYRGARKLPR
jgi:hypothetical protein